MTSRPNRPRCVSLALFVVLLTTGFAPICYATDFALRSREPGPGHRIASYWWTFNKGAWELTPPEGYTLVGGGELRLSQTADPGLSASCRITTDAERDLLGKDDPKAQAAYVRTLLPGGITDIKLVSQAKNPLPVNGLSNFEVVYSYALGGMTYQFACMVSQGGESNEQSPPVPGKPTPPPTPAPPLDSNGKPVKTGGYFTTIVACQQERYGVIYNALQQLLATAKIKPGEPGSDTSLQYISHGMLGR